MDKKKFDKNKYIIICQDDCSYINLKNDLISNIDIDIKYFLLLAYLKLYSSYDGLVNTSINDIVLHCGYSPNGRKDKINSDFINLLKQLQDEEHIEIKQLQLHKGYVDKDIFDLKPNEIFTIEFNPNDEEFNPVSKYCTLYKPIFEKICFTDTITDKATLLRIYLSILKRIDRTLGHDNTTFPSLNKLQKECTASSTKTINQGVKELEELKVIYIHRSGKFKNAKDKWQFANNIYGVTPDTIIGNEEQIEDNIKSYYQNNQHITIDRFIKDDQKDETDKVSEQSDTINNYAVDESDLF